MHAVLCSGLLLGIWPATDGALAQDNPATSVCKANDFRAMAYSINDEQVRERRALEWLSRYGKDCPFNEIEQIRSNVSVWLGTSNTPKVHQTVKELYLSKNPLPSSLEISKNSNTAPVIQPSGSIKTDTKADPKAANETTSTAPKKIKKLPNKVDEKIAASKEFALRQSEIAQCLPKKRLARQEY